MAPMTDPLPHSSHPTPWTGSEKAVDLDAFYEGGGTGGVEPKHAAITRLDRDLSQAVQSVLAWFIRLWNLLPQPPAPVPDPESSSSATYRPLTNPLRTVVPFFSQEQRDRLIALMWALGADLLDVQENSLTIAHPPDVDILLVAQAAGISNNPFGVGLLDDSQGAPAEGFPELEEPEPTRNDYAI